MALDVWRGRPGPDGVDERREIAARLDREPDAPDSARGWTRSKRMLFVRHSGTRGVRQTYEPCSCGRFCRAPPARSGPGFFARASLSLRDVHVRGAASAATTGRRTARPGDALHLQ